jgi:hypothetical protein
MKLTRVDPDQLRELLLNTPEDGIRDALAGILPGGAEEADEWLSFLSQIPDEVQDGVIEDHENFHGGDQLTCEICRNTAFEIFDKLAARGEK